MPETETQSRQRGQRERDIAKPATKPGQLPAPARPRFASLTLWLGLAGSLLLWAAFPPLGWAWLAWLAPLPWLWLARRPKLPGRWPYVALWLAGFSHWLLILEGIRLAHPALYGGWLALSAYLGVYLPVFVGLTRVAMQRWRVSLVVAAPLVWVGLELVRGHALTGFSMGLLAHTQAELPRLIQVADLAGGYTLSGVIMLVVACLARMIPMSEPVPRARPAGRAWWPLVPAAAAVAGTLLYGGWRLAQTPPGARGPTARVALIQGSLDTVFDMTSERIQETYAHYGELTTRATQEHANLDLVIWPESMFFGPDWKIEEPLARARGAGVAPANDQEAGETPAPRDPSVDELRTAIARAQADFQSVLAAAAARANANTSAEHPGTRLLVGTTTRAYGPWTMPRHYNTALLTDRSGQVLSRYFKMRAVMFGEYIPFADAIPLLYKITPMTSGMSVGRQPEVFDVAGLTMSPSICFESTIPHLIRRHVTELTAKGTPPDVLVNVTNDGWFWGSAMLDLHLRCAVFRAVENRKPLLVAANTGISTWVDGHGVIRQRGPRRQPEVLLAEVQADGRASPYTLVGDLPAWLLAAACALLAAVGLRGYAKREGEAPAEPRSRKDPGSAAASPSQQRPS